MPSQKDIRHMSSISFLAEHHGVAGKQQTRISSGGECDETETDLVFFLKSCKSYRTSRAAATFFPRQKVTKEVLSNS